MPFDFTKLPWEQAGISDIAASVPNQAISGFSSGEPDSMDSGSVMWWLLAAVAIAGLILLPRLLSQTMPQPDEEAQQAVIPWWLERL